MKAGFVQHEDLSALYGLEYNSERDGDAADYFDKHFSAPSVESVLIWIVAACVAVVENMMDWHKKEIDTKIARERYGHAGWYEQMALKFRYGENLNVNYTEEPDAGAADGDFSESVEYVDGDLTADEIEEMQIVKYAYCEDDEDGIGVVLKIAKDDNGSFAALSNAEKSAFDAYIKRIKPAGVPVAVISDAAKALSLGLTIYYNPLVLDGAGNRINGSGKPVEEAITGYIHSIGFNGWFTEQALVDAVQEADGVEIVGFDYAIVNATGETITHRYRPYSGHVRVDFNDCQIEYIANVKVRD